MDFLNPYATIDVSIIDLMRNMAVGLILAVIWAFVIAKTTRLVVDTRQYLPIFLLLIPSMILIISIIKSSIALSLGLVGALSIVRFRTPIKEPEELLYLFVAIAVGLGLGANQLIATFIGFTTICLALMPFAYLNKSGGDNRNTFVDVIFPDSENDIDIAKVEDILHDMNFNFDIKRIDTAGANTEILLDIVNFEMAKFQDLKKNLAKMGEDVNVIATKNARVIT